MIRRTLYVIVVALAVTHFTGSSATATTQRYDAYACTLQGTTGLTYVVEGSSLTTIRGICPVFERLFHQRQLRWGLHPPSFSSQESAKATWISRSLRAKLTLLAVPVPSLSALIRAVGALLSPKVWHRASTSNYP
jgi:hypothetical protein